MMNISKVEQKASIHITASILTWNTGRLFSEMGQRIAAAVLPSTGQVVFVDSDRGINGVTRDPMPVGTNISDLEKFVMDEYDQGRYTDGFSEATDIWKGSRADTSGFIIKMKLAAKEQMKNETVILHGSPKCEFDPVSPEGYALVMADKALQLSWQDRLDSVFGERIVDVRNALREAGWEGEPRSPVLTRGDLQVEFDALHVGAGANVVGGNWRLLATNNMKLSLNGRTIAELPDMLTGTAAELADEIDLMRIRETARISENSRRSPQELTFKEFSEIATISKLENHGRQWAIEFGQQNLGFADGASMEGGMRQAHAREVNNAVYTHLPGEDAKQKRAFPPEKVQAEYPDLRVKFAEVFEARDKISSPSASFTVWVYDHVEAVHHNNELKSDTVANVDVATAIARFRVQETNHETGWAKIIDNTVAGKMGDRGHVLNIEKTKNGGTRISNKNDGVEIENIQAHASKSYFGSVTKVINSEFALQDIGRKQVVLHQVSKLDLALQVGDMASIKYDADGRGKVDLEKLQDKSVGR